MCEFVALPDRDNVLVSGQSQSGKTVWTKRLLEHHKVTFKSPPDLIIYVYRHWQQIYKELHDKLGDKIRFTPDVPTEEQLIAALTQFQEQNTGKKCKFLLVVDDHMEKLTRDRLFYDLVTRIGHHFDLSNIFLVQDASLSGPFRKEFLSNIHLNTFMSNARDRASIRQLAMLLSDYKCIMASYDDSNQGRGSYFCVCTHPSSDPALKYRTKIFPDDLPHGPVIYQSKKHDLK